MHNAGINLKIANSCNHPPRWQIDFRQPDCNVHIIEPNLINNCYSTTGCKVDFTSRVKNFSSLFLSKITYISVEVMIDLAVGFNKFHTCMRHFHHFSHRHVVYYFIHFTFLERLFWQKLTNVQFVTLSRRQGIKSHEYTFPEVTYTTNRVEK